MSDNPSLPKTFLPGVVLLSTVGFFATDSYLPSFPSIVKSLSTSVHLVQLTLSFYFLSFSLSQLFYGPLSDKFGRRNIVLFGLSFSFFGSIVCLFAPNIYVLIIGRLLQGMAFGAASAVFRAILRDVYSGDKLAFYGSFLAMGSAITIAVAPTIGGYTQSLFGWKANFVIILIYSIITLLWIYFWLPETNKNLNPNATKLKTFFGTYWHLLKNPIFIGYSFCGCLTLAGIEAFLAASPFLLQDVVGLSPVEYGWLGFILGAGIAIGGVLNGTLVKRVNRHRMLLVGIACMTLSGVLMLLFGYLGYINTLTIMGPIMLYTIGSAPAFASAFAGAFQPFAKIAGFAGGIYTGIQMLGGAIVTAIVAALHEKNQIPLGYILLIIGVFMYFFQWFAFSFAKKSNCS